MQKPTIFFSHSSVDKEYISRLKDMVLRSTARTVEVFVSSDGESVPFGNNWIHKVEENLNKAKIMLVFVSPKSALSNWIYFEAGFAYAKDVKVIPIGICGLDVGKLKPPLNLLQGFNVSDADGLNNIITVINREFNCDFPKSYKQSDFDGLAILGGNDLSINDEALGNVDYIQFSFPKTMRISDHNVTIVSQPMKHIEETLINHGITYRYSKSNKIHSHGLIVTENTKDNDLSIVSIMIDPYCLAINEKLLIELFSKLYVGGEINKFWVNILFNKNVSLETKELKLSSKLHMSGFDISTINGRYYFFDSMDFTLEAAVERHDRNEINKDSLRVIFDSRLLSSKKIFSLISKLIQSKVIHIES